MKKLIVLFFFVIGILSGSAVQAQVTLGGLLDLEVRRAGSDSSPVINQTPKSYWSLYTPNLRLFIQGDISEKWFVSAALHADHYEGRTLSEPFFSVINLNWMPDPDGSLMVTGGRFVTPFAGYSDLLLSSQNRFVHLPLAMARNVSIDKYRGFFTGSASYYGTHGMAILYQRMYTQGIKLKGGSLKDDGWTYLMAATLASVSSHSEYGEHQRPNLIGSVQVQPVIWAKFGATANFGPFMRRADVNDQALSDEQFSEYDQLAVGGFAEFSYHYFMLRMAGIWNRWKAPYIDYNDRLLYDDLKVNVSHVISQLTYRFPFLVGGYAGLRVEQLIEGPLKNNSSPYLIPEDYAYQPIPNDWLDDTTRLEGVLGYKLDRNILLKVSYLYAHNENGDLADNVFSIQLSAGF